MVESQNCLSSFFLSVFFFFLQPAQRYKVIRAAFKIVTNSQEILWSDLYFERNWDLLPALFCGED